MEFWADVLFSITSFVTFFGLIAAGVHALLGWIGFSRRRTRWYPIAPAAGILFGAAAGILFGAGIEPVSTTTGLFVGLVAWGLALLTDCAAQWIRQRLALRRVAETRVFEFARDLCFADEATLTSVLEELEERLDIRYLPTIGRADARPLESLDEREPDDYDENYVLAPHGAWTRRRDHGRHIETLNPFAGAILRLRDTRITVVSEHPFGRKLLRLLGG